METVTAPASSTFDQGLPDDSKALGVLMTLQARYNDSLDAGRLDEWPSYFAETARYEIISRSNLTRGLSAHAMLCQGKGMMLDRVMSLQEANIYAEQTYRHVTSAPLIIGGDGQLVKTRTAYLVMRTDGLTGRASVFSTGCYEDIVEFAPTPHFIERRVVMDNDALETLLALPL